MRLIRASSNIESPINGELMIQRLEKYGRNSYKSEDHITPNSARNFVSMIINKGHESVLEHESVTARFITDRGVTHELVRHRLAAYTQESTRYCNYTKDKFDNSLTFIRPSWFPSYIREGEYTLRNISPLDGKPDDEDLHVVYQGFNDEVMSHSEWMDMANSPEGDMLLHLANSEEVYNNLIKKGWKPQQARAILPHAIKTEIISTFNLREWRHVFQLRAVNKRAHPQIREVMIPLLYKMQDEIPVVFDDLKVEE